MIVSLFILLFSLICLFFCSLIFPFQATMQAIVQTIRDIVQYNTLFGQQINLLLHPSQNVIDNPVYLCDLVATIVQSVDTSDLQEIMEEVNVSNIFIFILESI